MNSITIRDNLTQSPAKAIVRAALIVTLAVSIFVLAFTWPTKTMETKDLPISISGSAEMVQKVEDTLNEKAPGTFDFVEAESRDDAVQQIKERETYGGIILSDDGAPEVLTAAAASTATNNMLNNLATQLTAQTQAAATAAQTQALTDGINAGNEGIAALQAQIDAANATIEANNNEEEVNAAKATVEQLTPQLTEAQAKVAAAQAQLDSLNAQAQVKEKTTATVTNVVELSEDDSTGAGLTVAAFPLVIGGMLGGIMVMTLVQGVRSRLLASTLAAILGGLALTLILHTWFGFLEGNFGLLWLAFIVSNLATSFFIIGVGSLLGKGAGIGLGVLTTMLVGNPISGASSPWEFIPSPWGVIGQHMVPGASSHLLRSLSYFPDASTAAQWTTLTLWILGGLILAGIGFAVARKNKDRIAPEHKVLAEAV